MFKLTAKNDSTNRTWYFRRARQMRRFISILEDHDVNIDWNIPVKAKKFPEMTADDFADLRKGPINRASDALSWALNSYFKDDPHYDTISAKIAKSIIDGLKDCPFVIMV